MVIDVHEATVKYAWMVILIGRWWIRMMVILRYTCEWRPRFITCIQATLDILDEDRIDKGKGTLVSVALVDADTPLF